MHVLLATNNLYPDPGATGSGRYNYEVGRELVERGHEVTVLTRSRGDVPERETVAGMDVHRYGASMARLPLVLREIRRRVEAIHADRPIDLVSFHGALSSLGVDRALPDALPRIYTVHGLWGVEYRDRLVDPSPWAAPWHWLNRSLRHRVEARLLGRSDRVIVLSEFMRARLARYHPDAQSATVVPGGVDVERFVPGAAIDDQPHDEMNTDRIDLLTVRRLTPRMGLETLLDSFARIADDADDPDGPDDPDAADHPDVHLSIAGDGPLREALVDRTERLGIESDVSFLGYVPDEELPALYAGADLFVLPTLELEGFGLVTLEALASGTPVVGTSAGATPELLEPLAERSAIPEPLLVDPGDTDALAERLDAWTALSPGQRRAAGSEARSYVLESGYTWADVTDQLEDVFEDCQS